MLFICLDLAFKLFLSVPMNAVDKIVVNNLKCIETQITRPCEGLVGSIWDVSMLYWHTRIDQLRDSAIYLTALHTHLGRYFQTWQ
jgi:hypothetical protein